jgi:TPR repeat protein
MRSPKDNIVESDSEQKLRLSSVFEESRIEPTHVLSQEGDIQPGNRVDSPAFTPEESSERPKLMPPAASSGTHDFPDRARSPVAIGRLPLPVKTGEMLRRAPFFSAVLVLALVGGAFKELEHPELIGRSPTDLISDAFATKDILSTESFALLRRAAKMGSRDSLGIMGCLCEGRDQRKALTYYTAAARAGDPLSTYKLAEYYVQGVNLPINKQKAFQLHLKNAQNGFPLSGVAVATMYRDGQGTKVDEKEAFRWYLTAANQGQQEAFYPLAMCFYNGYGTQRNVAEAVRWLQNASTEAAAGELLGDIFSSGKDVTADYNEARNYYWEATWSGNTSAMKKLARMYEKGIGDVQDLSQAISLYKQAGDWRSAERLRKRLN